MKTPAAKFLMIIFVIAVIAGIPGTPEAIEIPPSQVTVSFINQKSYQVKMSCSVSYLVKSVMHSIDVDEWVPAGKTVHRIVSHASIYEIVYVSAVVYFNGQTFRTNYNTDGVKSVTIVAVPDNLVGSYPQHMNVLIQ